MNKRCQGVYCIDSITVRVIDIVRTKTQFRDAKKSKTHQICHKRQTYRDQGQNSKSSEFGEEPIIHNTYKGKWCGVNDDMSLKWHGKYSYNETNVKNYVGNKGGNYMISVKLKSGNYRPIYVGKTKYLKTRLLGHLEDSNNACLKNHVSKHMLYFIWCDENNDENRTNIEYTLYKEYSPECNEDIPEGVEISITLPY